MRILLSYVSVPLLVFALTGCGSGGKPTDKTATIEETDFEEWKPDLKKMGIPENLPEVLPPDLSARAEKESYKKAVAKVAELCKAKAQPVQGLIGVFQFKVSHKKSASLVKEHQKTILDMGAYFCRFDQSFGIGGAKDTLIVVPTTDRYEVMATVSTNAANYEMGTNHLIAWMKNLEKEQPHVLTGIGFDVLEGYFTSEIKDPKGLAKRMYDFCPDIVDQGVGDVDKLEKQLREKKSLYLWWD